MTGEKPTANTIETLQDYLDALSRELTGSDPALVRDALYDAQEHFRDAREAWVGQGSPDEGSLTRFLLESFGDPAEVAAAYRETEDRVARALSPPSRPAAASPLDGAFGVLADPRAYGALLFMLVSLITGILTFTWVVSGLSLSLGFGLFIFGLPFFLLFVSSVHAIALVEGRLVESMLGERMPRRPPRGRPNGTWLQRLRFWATDRGTWTTMLYLVLRLPLGVLSFSVAIMLVALCLSLLATPWMDLLFGLPTVQIGETRYHVPFWTFPIFWGLAALDLLLLMHVARWFGRLSAGLAKRMLVAGGR